MGCNCGEQSNSKRRDVHIHVTLAPDGTTTSEEVHVHIETPEASDEEVLRSVVRAAEKHRRAGGIPPYVLRGL